MDNSTDNQKQKRFADGGGKFVVPTGIEPVSKV
jgi:hypothetical protein